MDLIPDFLDIRAGRKKAEYADPRLIPILEDTAGIMVYQEQVMLVAQKIGGYSLGGADILRRAMGKKDVAEMERQSKVFIEGAAKNGVSEEVAAHLFELMRKFAGYGFNKSHAAAYSYVAYKTGWLKNYYPAEFLASSLSEVMTDPEKSLKILMDAKRHSVKLLGPDINESEFNYTSPKTMEIRMGLGALKGVGSAPAEAIKAEREQNGPFKDPFDLVKRVGSQLITKKIIQVFAMAGVFDSIEPNRRKWFENADVVVQSAQENEKAADQFSLFGEEPSNEVPIKEVAPWSDRTRMEKEQYVLGFYFSGHPLEAYQSELKRNFGALVAGTESENPGNTSLPVCISAANSAAARTVLRSLRCIWRRPTVRWTTALRTSTSNRKESESKRFPKARLWSWNLKSLTVRRAERPGQVPEPSIRFTNCAIARERILSFGRRKKLIRRSSSA